MPVRNGCVWAASQMSAAASRNSSLKGTSTIYQTGRGGLAEATERAADSRRPEVEDQPILVGAAVCRSSADGRCPHRPKAPEIARKHWAFGLCAVCAACVYSAVRVEKRV